MKTFLVCIMCGAIQIAGNGWAEDRIPPNTPARMEHVAFASDREYLDGPVLEALGSGHGALPAGDSVGNVYYIWKYSTCRIRCLRADGRVETIAGDDRWPGIFSEWRRMANS